MKRVLAVSEDADFHEFLREACRSQDGFQIASARNGFEAMAELRLRRVSVAILDLDAKTWDSYHLLSEIHGEAPDLAMLGLTRTPTMAVERRMKQAGPVRMLGRDAAPEALLEEINTLLDDGTTGHIEGIQLSSLLQVLDWERKNCLVRVQDRGRAGLLYFQRGFLIHAECGGLHGETAALEVLAWDDARIDFLPQREVERSIHLPLKELLLMAAERRDVAARKGSEPGPAA